MPAFTCSHVPRENQRIMLRDKTWFLTLTSWLKYGLRVPVVPLNKLLRACFKQFSRLYRRCAWQEGMVRIGVSKSFSQSSLIYMEPICRMMADNWKWKWHCIAYCHEVTDRAGVHSHTQPWSAVWWSRASWSFTDPGGMEDWVGLTTRVFTVVSDVEG